MERLSSWASEERIVKSNSPEPSRVLIPSFSNTTPMPRSLSSRVYFRQSWVFRANRLIDFVMTMSIFPALQSSIIRLNSLRFCVLVPLSPSSA